MPQGSRRQADYNPAVTASLRAIAGIAALLAFAIFTRSAASFQAPQAVCPAVPTPTIAPQAPSDVCIPDGFKDIAVEYFDDFSWRTFVALVWPAASTGRGVPDSGRRVSDTGLRTFETFKSLWETFPDDGVPPQASFDKYDTATHNPCNVQASFGDITIGSFSGIDDIGQAGIGVLDGPLVAQNGRYVRTATFYNKLAFDFIVRNGYFMRSALPPIPRPRPERPVVEFPVGSIAIKTAWIDVTGLSPALVKRFYTRSALVKSPAGAGCSQTTVGLVGLHIAQKTPSRPQWVWSSFEQNDLAPPAWPDAPGVFVLNDRSGTPMPPRNPLSLSPLAPEPAKPFNVVRFDSAPLLTRTELTSFAYQHLLAGTPWRYYKLVVTQWPRLEGNQASPIPPTVDGTPPNTFPGEGAFSAFANLTMETFDQRGIQLGCMSCHNRSRMTTDFMWTVFDRAYPPRLAPGNAADPTDR